MKELKQVEITENKLDDVLSIYRNVHNALNVVVESVIQLRRLGLVNEDIEKINSIKNKKTNELFKYVGDIEYFKENFDKILNELI